MSRTVFQLNVTQIESVCHFELRGEGHTISVNLNYPPSLIQSYKQWQKAYLDYYRYLRGRKVISGGGSSPVDRNQQLVNAEARLLNEFHRWLLSADLVSIRREVAKAAREGSELEKHYCEVFLSCTPIEIARLPWETWEIGTDLGIPEKIRITRTPATILNEPVHPLRRKVRILAILGDDTGLNFEIDKQAVRSLRHIAEVKFVGWKPEAGTDVIDVVALKTEIVQAIASEGGWDVLFFAGHSNETVLTGGELGIAPNVSLSIWEIEEALKQAKQRGLQFAIFNSCSGINIAESLINLGLSQVVVMREPIHNQVAQEFLMQFLKSLVEYKDVHEALLDASHYLKQQESRFSYPSAYLVPSLFRHPDAELFRIKPFGFWSTIKQWLPSRKEAAWLGVLLLLSLVPDVQNLLLEPRILLQAIYRKVTFQVPSENAPSLLVQIDSKSLNADDIQQRYPLDYSYLAKVVKKLSQLNANLIGVDYILDKAEKQPESTQQLKQSILDAVAQKKTLFVFASHEYENPKKGKVSPEIASFNWSLEGDTNFYNWYVEILSKDTEDENYPFSYLLSLANSLQKKQPKSVNLPQPSLLNKKSFHSLIINPNNVNDNQTDFLYELRLHSISNLCLFDPIHPIIDFSIPPSRAYKKISACELLGSCEVKEDLPKTLHNRVVIIAPGVYEESGLDREGDNKDSYFLPLAVAFWRGDRGWHDWFNVKRTFTGGEAHAYMIHHLLTRRLVVSIPDFLIILFAAVVGKYITIILRDNPSQRKKLVMILGGATAGYVILSLQIYTSEMILLPWLLPSVALWNYVRMALKRKSYG